MQCCDDPDLQTLMEFIIGLKSFSAFWSLRYIRLFDACNHQIHPLLSSSHPRQQAACPAGDVHDGVPSRRGPGAAHAG